MEKYWQITIDSFTGYWNYLFQEISEPGIHNYFYWLVGLSLLAWALELAMPWRKNQKAIRKDFWQDGFYMFFNFFLFSLIGFNAVSNIGVEAFSDFLQLLGIENLVAFEIQSWPSWAKLLTLFLVADFVQWNIHRLLHKVPFLWEFHKVHHSVKEMGFAAHLRYHWVETFVYKTIQYLPLAMIGFGIQDFFLVHIFTVAIGHINHANVGWDYGPLKYIFNNPKMHIWHHAKEMPSSHPTGINFGISLSIWDYLFKTAYIPHSGKDIELGYDDVDKMPQSFWGQITRPFKAVFSKE
jgi:sterol desaturase/sphingolipid hydroxylase (fatty acid hydroxylase superfamily)